MTNLGYTPEEPISAIATPLVSGAIGIVRASGKNSIELASNFFSRPKALLEASGNTLVYGWVLDGGIKVDEVMVGVYRNPKSFTGEDMVEVFCHGGVSVVTAIQNVFLQNGFRQAERGEFTFRSYINGKTDLTKAEAVKEIIDSKTSISRSKAATRLAGNLFDVIDGVKKNILEALAAIEVEIEYPEDEENIAEYFDTTLLKEVKKSLESLKSSWKSEKLFQDGARIVLCGKTNAGKSSLFNTLLKEDRAIVSDIEGTTRDWLESYADFDGIPVRLFDTAGLRETDDVIEARGVELTKDLSNDADVILYLVDSNSGISEDDKEFIVSQKNIPLIVVFNKCDSGSVLSQTYKDKDCVSISAKKGVGIEELVFKTKKILLAGKESSRDGVGLGSERQKKSVEEALECVTHAIETAENHEYGLDAVVQDLEDSLDSLGELTGEVTSDDVLRTVFENFCVGK